MEIRFLQDTNEHQRGSAIRIAELLEKAHAKGMKQNFETMANRDEHGNMTYCAYGAAYSIANNLTEEEMLRVDRQTHRTWGRIILSFGDPYIKGIETSKLKQCGESCLIRSTLLITGCLHLSHYIIHMHDCEKLTFTELAAKLREIN